MEDATTLSVVLPLGTTPEELPERLQLYEKIRYERANNIQEYSRQAGKDFVDGKPTVDSRYPRRPGASQADFDSDEIHSIQFRLRRIRQLNKYLHQMASK